MTGLSSEEPVFPLKTGFTGGQKMLDNRGQLWLVVPGFQESLPKGLHGGSN